MKRILLLCLLVCLSFRSFGEIPQFELMGDLQLPVEDAEFTHDLIVHGNIAYVANWRPRDSNARVFLADMSDPNAPVVLSEYVSERESTKSGYEMPTIFQMDLQFPYLFVPHSDGFDVVDVSDPTSPVLASEFTTENVSGGAIKVFGSKVILTHSNMISFIQMDDNFQSDPTFEMVFDIENTRGERGTDTIWDGGDTVYVLVQAFPSRPGLAGLQVIDVSRFEEPRTITFLRYPFDEPRGPSTLRGFLQLGQHLFVNGYSDAENSFWIPVVDISTKDSPFVRDIIRMQPWIRNWFRFKKHLIGASSVHGLAVYEIENDLPVFQQMILDPTPANDGFAFVAGQDDIMVALLDSFQQKTDFLQVFTLQQPSSLDLFEAFQ